VPRSRVSLDAWYIPAPDATASVVIGHAIGRNKGFSLPYAEFLHRAGYNVLVFDLRNHGASDQDRAFWHMARRFTDDVHAAVSWLRATHSSDIAMLTFSFSTFPALHVLNRDVRAVDAVVSDSGPCLNVETVSRNFLEAGKAHLPAWAGRPHVFDAFARVYAFAVTRMLSVDWPPAPGRFTTPVLFIANECDVIIPAADVQAFATNWQHGELWHVPGAAHLAAYKADPAGYSQRVVSFLARAFANAADRAPSCA
jgi:pimeloyl-ACP methyl ester carboxylesterase